MSETALVHYNQARRALQRAVAFDEVKAIRDKAERLRVYSRQVGESLDAQNNWAEIKLRAERRAGEMLREGKENGHRATPGRPEKTNQDDWFSKPTLAEIGITQNQSTRWQSIANIPEEEFEEVIQQTKEAGQELTETAFLRVVKEQKREAVREQNRALVERVAPAPVAVADARYQTIVIDPPWDWGDEGDADQFGRARPTYATMRFEEVAALPVSDLSEKDAHIYLWITNRSLPKGFALLEQWGFRYVTTLTWCKPSIGMGNYFRGSTEHVLFGVRGSRR